eukprot:TRINITY_DN2949_c0_g1_i1.p1 TRINITY_DN2949_c0_g1~~TRINITY_DN2949_c0_g1_i1.p1  ORF type:complete len:187 (+),score=26.64 TRINITY_DN2949_c0_g1_i1:197-757(+)
MTTPSLKEWTMAEVKAKCVDKEIWMVIRGLVYDLTDFKHPGGRAILRKYRGKDATAAFNAYHKYINLEMVHNLVRGKVKVETIKLKGGVADETAEIRTSLEKMGITATELSDEEIIAQQRQTTDDTDDAYISEVFMSIADPATKAIQPSALRSFLTELGAPSSTIDALVTDSPIKLSEFRVLVENL